MYMFKWAEDKREEYNFTLYGYCWDVDTRLQAHLLTLRDMLLAPVIAWRQKRCRHDWEVNSHITPDSGYEDFTCKKCGLHHTVNWY